MDRPRYTVIETDSGPKISESRTYVLDVMQDYDAGDSIYEIADTYNLTPLQVETAVAYIREHRADLELMLVEALRLKAEREAYYNALAAEIQHKIDQKPMTPERAAFYAFREQARRKWAELMNGTSQHMDGTRADRIE